MITRMQSRATHIAGCLGGCLGLDRCDSLFVLVVDQRVIEVAVGVALGEYHLCFLQAALADQPLKSQYLDCKAGGELEILTRGDSGASKKRTKTFKGPTIWMRTAILHPQSPGM